MRVSQGHGHASPRGGGGSVSVPFLYRTVCGKTRSDPARNRETTRTLVDAIVFGTDVCLFETRRLAHFHWREGNKGHWMFYDTRTFHAVGKTRASTRHV